MNFQYNSASFYISIGIKKGEWKQSESVSNIKTTVLGNISLLKKFKISHVKWCYITSAFRKKIWLNQRKLFLLKTIFDLKKWFIWIK